MIFLVYSLLLGAFAFSAAWVTATHMFMGTHCTVMVMATHMFMGTHCTVMGSLCPVKFLNYLEQNRSVRIKEA
jgi:hypothetical protein